MLGAPQIARLQGATCSLSHGLLSPRGPSSARTARSRGWLGSSSRPAKPARRCCPPAPPPPQGGRRCCGRRWPSSRRAPCAPPLKDTATQRAEEAQRGSTLVQTSRWDATRARRQLAPQRQRAARGRAWGAAAHPPPHARATAVASLPPPVGARSFAPAPPSRAPGARASAARAPSLTSEACCAAVGVGTRVPCACVWLGGV